jgi:hypothetical protein
MPSIEFEDNKKVPQWILDTYNNQNSDPKDLTAIQQNSLFVYDMFNN